jgi:hypothetical protein
MSVISRLVAEEDVIHEVDDEHEETDKSGGPSVISKVVCKTTEAIPETNPRVRRFSLEGQIVDVMDKWCAVKATKITSICLNYDKQIAEIEGQADLTNPADVMTMVIEQLKTSKEAEIAAVSAEIDEKRKAEIRVVRENYN